MAAMMVTVSGATFPSLPGSRAMAGASTYSSPARRTTSSVVAKRTPVPVMQTVPAPMGRSLPMAAWMPKRSVPVAQVAMARLMPLSWAWRSR